MPFLYYWVTCSQIARDPHSVQDICRFKCTLGLKSQISPTPSASLLSSIGNMLITEVISYYSNHSIPNRLQQIRVKFLYLCSPEPLFFGTISHKSYPRGPCSRHIWRRYYCMDGTRYSTMWLRAHSKWQCPIFFWAGPGCLNNLSNFICC